MRAADFILVRLLCWFAELGQGNLHNGKERETETPDRAHRAIKDSAVCQQRKAQSPGGWLAWVRKWKAI